MEQTLRVIDKTQWNRGPWDDEPDQKNYITASGLSASILRAEHSGSLCGYVGVPPSHPWFGKEYSDAVIPSAEQLARPVDTSKISLLSLLCSAGDDPSDGARIDCIIRVHGGLTYSGEGRERCGEDPALWYFGFDCAHSGDLCPAMDWRSRFRNYEDVYRDFDYVQRDVELLAAQLAEIAA